MKNNEVVIYFVMCLKLIMVLFFSIVEMILMESFC